MTACPSCGSPIDAEDRFCGTCGADLTVRETTPRFCTSCGGPLEEDDRFCGRCGAPVRGTASEPEPESEAEAEEEDFFADWNRMFAEEPSPQEAITEAVPRAGSDTELLQSTSAPTPAPERPAAPPVPAPPRTPRHPPPRGFPWGASVALAGGVAVVISGILPWTSTGAVPREIAARSLVQAEAEGGVNLGVVLLVAGTVGAAVALLTMLAPWLGFLRRLIGILTLAVPVLFVLRALDPAAGFGDLLQALSAGVYVAAGGALAQVVAGKLRA